MRFSIVTITKDSENFLAHTLQSVKEQDFKDFEHIIWDGGSSDNTLEITWQFPHVKVFEGHDTGIGDAMNKGTQLARGDFILHLHSDDMLAHPKVLSQVDTFLRQHSQFSWVYGQAEIIDAMGNLKRTTQFTPYSAQRLRKYNIISHPSTFLSRKLFNRNGGFRSDLSYCMDYELWLRLSEQVQGLAMPFVVSKFREHANSQSISNAEAVTDEAYKVRNNYVKNPLERFKSMQTWKKRRNSLGQ